MTAGTLLWLALSYAQLEAASAAIAAALHRNGVLPGMRVGVSLTRSRWLVATLLGWCWRCSRGVRIVLCGMLSCLPITGATSTLVTTTPPLRSFTLEAQRRSESFATLEQPGDRACFGGYLPQESDLFDEERLRIAMGRIASVLAHGEGLQGHARAAEMRLK